MPVCCYVKKIETLTYVIEVSEIVKISQVDTFLHCWNTDFSTNFSCGSDSETLGRVLQIFRFSVGISRGFQKFSPKLESFRSIFEVFLEICKISVDFSSFLQNF